MKEATAALKSVLTIYIQDKLVSTIDLEHNGEQQEFSFGRSSGNAIVLSSSIVSSHHGKFEIKDNSCYIHDLDSTNGIYVNGEQVKSAKLENGDHIRIDMVDQPHNEGILMIYSLLESNSDEKWNQFLFDNKQTITIGRESTNDIAIPHSMVSRKHARLVKQGNEFFVEDLNSTNGTYLNGQLVKSKEKLKSLDVIFVGNTKIIFQDNKVIYNVQTKGLRIDAIHISKIVQDSTSGLFKEKKQKKILDDINISIKSGELVALVGGSGAGKSTFMDAINGFRPPTEGSVLVNGDDFFSNYNAYKNIMGYVPQQDIVYDTLTVRGMLTYAARLRMPEDTSEQEINARVEEVIADVELEGREDLVIKQLSGGQRKRASIAVELLADPKLFYLDEPTSGLDPGMERNMMKLLRKLSNTGKTIILITHATLNLHLCDKVIFLGYGGRLCYFGPPNGALEFFGVEDYADIYDLINKESDKWQSTFKKSKYYGYYNSLSEKTAHSNEKNVVHKRSSFKQLLILTSRYLKLTLIDKQRLFFLLLQAPFIAFMIGLVSKRNAFVNYETTKEVVFTLAASGVWIGLLNAIQEITKERDIYRRERAVNIKLLPYLGSKIIVLGSLSLIQSILFIEVFSWQFDLPDVHLIGSLKLEYFISLFLTTLASTAFGLLISTFVANPDRAMGLAPIILIPQLIFNGLVFKLKDVSEYISYLAISKWAARAFSISIDLNAKPLEIESETPVPPRETPTYYQHDVSHLYQNWEILFGIVILCLVLSLIVLKQKDKQ